ncbi:cell division protein FtsA [Candidatus Shapirobacteria bacterium RBG_13_44_7]|uniref:Cell division protein FtsA n=1 Tax=Candidatus Shapirobacteria bacterium RBG_13_44_7 TaxID=1802149 RepID=A0A1F7SF01_9BACT|nr:MAG: cell division protein FtsA [Candidatus Shapirobacteria bacterium RBG_13_44_7]
MSHSKIISGIDIGTSKITTIVGQHHQPEDRLNIIAVSSVPTNGFRKGQIINLEEATRTIIDSVESAERMAGFSINQALVSITAPHLESVNSQGVITIGNPNGQIIPDDVDRVIEASKAISIPPGKEIFHVIPRTYTVDHQEGILDPISMSGLQLETESHLILASTSSLSNLKKCLDDAGINPIATIYSGLATAKATLTPTEKELGVALIDIGGSLTTVTIYLENSPAFSTVLPIGGNNVTNDLAIGLRMSLEDTEKIKLRLGRISENKKFEDEIDLSDFGLSDNSSKKISYQTAVNGIIQPRLEELFSLLYQKITQSGLANSIPAGIVLTGGGSLTVCAKEICNQNIPLPLRIAYPPKIGGIVDDIITPAYTTAIGLILYGLEENLPKRKSKSTKKTSVSFTNLFSKVKSLLEPLLP